MKLTGKALEYFFLWLGNQGTEGIDISNFEFNSFLKLSKTSQNALIIEWFDSVGIYINIGGVMVKNISEFSFDIQQNNTLNGIDSYGFNTRQQATEQAIIKTNKLYNSKYIQDENKKRIN